ncbi:uncharacterized protein [Watersipora subatra]|uniref:uncharacterized protein n=1 Tax=Watersipora subatra TaxID=2589382 RepID=UPI00355ADA15
MSNQPITDNFQLYNQSQHRKSEVEAGKSSYKLQTSPTKQSVDRGLYNKSKCITGGDEFHHASPRLNPNYQIQPQFISQHNPSMQTAQRKDRGVDGEMLVKASADRAPQLVPGVVELVALAVDGVRKGFKEKKAKEAAKKQASEKIARDISQAILQAVKKQPK